MKIVHIICPTLIENDKCEKKLKKIFEKTTIIKNLNELKKEYIKKNYGEKKYYYFEEKKYQNYIYKYIEENLNKSMIFIGFNFDVKNPKRYYDLKTTQKYVINIDVKIIMKEKINKLFCEYLTKIKNKETDKNINALKKKIDEE